VAEFTPQFGHLFDWARCRTVSSSYHGECAVLHSVYRGHCVSDFGGVVAGVPGLILGVPIGAYLINLWSKPKEI